MHSTIAILALLISLVVTDTNVTATGLVQGDDIQASSIKSLTAGRTGNKFGDFAFTHQGPFFTHTFVAKADPPITPIINLINNLISISGYRIKAVSPERVAVNNPNMNPYQPGLKIQPNRPQNNRLDILRVCFVCAKLSQRSQDDGSLIDREVPCTVGLSLSYPHDEKKIEMETFNVKPKQRGGMVCKTFEGEKYQNLTSVSMSAFKPFKGPPTSEIKRIALIFDEVKAVVRNFDEDV